MEPQIAAALLAQGSAPQSPSPEDMAAQQKMMQAIANAPSQMQAMAMPPNFAQMQQMINQPMPTNPYTAPQGGGMPGPAAFGFGP